MIQKLFIAALILVGAYVFFIVAPSVTSFFAVFTRKTGTPLSKINLQKSYLAPFYEKLIACRDKTAARKREEVSITASDGTELCALYCDVGGKITALFVPGYNAVPENNYAYTAEMLLENGINVLSVFNRAHAGSGGKRSTLGIKESGDVLLWAEWLKTERGAGNIIVYGTSMGCCAVSLASDKFDSETVKGLILDCGYESVYAQMIHDMKMRHLPASLMIPIVGLLCKIILKIDIKTSVRDSLKNCVIPAFFLHGTADRTVPFSEGEKNFEACASKKEKLFVKGADHTVSLLTSGEEGKKQLLDFINNCVEGE